MKNLISIITISLLIVCPVFSQDGGDFRFGVSTGLNFALPVGEDIDDWKNAIDDYVDYYDDYDQDYEESLKPRVGLNLGITMDYFLADNFSLSTGISYSQKGFVWKQNSEREFSDYDYNNYEYESEEATLDQKVKVNLNYLDIPITLRFASDDGFEIFGGVVLGLLMSDKVNASASYDGSIDYWEEYYEDFGDDMEDYKDAFGEKPEGTVTGLTFGLGYTIDEQINISLSGQQTSSFGETPYGDDNHNLTIQLRVGYFF